MRYFLLLPPRPQSLQKEKQKIELLREKGKEFNAKTPRRKDAKENI